MGHHPDRLLREVIAWADEHPLLKCSSDGYSAPLTLWMRLLHLLDTLLH